MALKGLSPSSAHSSPSPDLASDGPSTNASPVSASTSLYISQASDEGDSSGHHSSRGTPTRFMSDLTRSASAGKGGCWTCRVRRKKCDEEREGDSCKTCLRLRIKCLGWGPKRPDWMRDKEKVAAYKADIKEQLSRMGLIRGQPRQLWHGLPSSSQPSTPGVAGPGPHTTLRRAHSDRQPQRREPGYRRAPYHLPTLPGGAASGKSPTHPSVRAFACVLVRVPCAREAPAALAISPIWSETPRTLARIRSRARRNLPGVSWLLTAAPAGPEHAHNIPASSRQCQISPMVSFLPAPASAATMSDPLYGFPQSAPSVPPPLSGGGDDGQYGYLPRQGLPMPAPSPPTPAIRQEDYIRYYFDHVRELQFVFSGESLASILYPLVQADPNGAVALSLCALAALHHARVRLAQGAGPIVDDPDSENSPPRQFYDRALYRLMHGPQTNGMGQYADADAVAAVQLVSYVVLGGGTMDWMTPLEYACEWLAQTGIYNEENPKLTLLNMTPAGRFAAKATMYIDVIASITLKQPPRFLPLYKRLFGGGGGGFWAASAGVATGVGAPHVELRMDALTGCPDEALLALAEISALAHWKTSELHNGTLSVRELIRRGDLIEKELGQRAAASRRGTAAAARGLDMGVAPAGLPMSMGMPQPQPGLVGAGQMPRGTVDTTKHTVAEMFREAAILYLHTVLSDSAPGVPEIVNSVEQMMKLLNELPPSAYDRALMLPLFLAGVMTDTQVLREVVKRRFFMQDATMGNVLLAQTVMEQAWMQRTAFARGARMGDRPPRVGDWRDHLRMEWASLLLI
ncbi:fungal-specific transcription factor domain-containing protein [Trametes elegans]|nr:fungal-specific transcription factor domain-containing protein [Trametes elegans]